jgi:hypothetical protein
MAVAWAAELVSANPVVQYTPVSSKTEPVTSFSFSSPGMWTTFPNYNKPYILQRQLHSCKAVMVNLTAGQLYRYRVGSEIYGWSSQFNFYARRNFTVSPLTRLLVYGDLGVGPEIDVTMLRLILETENVEYDAIIHNGDFAYDFRDEMGEVGDRFMRAIEPIASKVPYMVSQGNHEGVSNINHYYHRFSMPGNSSNLFYSFNLGKIHFISYSTEFIFINWTDLQAAQQAFIVNDLATYDKEMYPWLVVFGHRPLYCSANMTASVNLHSDFPPFERHNQDCLMNASTVRTAFEDLWYNAKVDLAIESHVHAYERLASVYQNESVPCEYQDNNTYINAKAPVYIVTGVPGQQESYAPNSPTPLPFSVFQDDQWGFSRLTAFNGTHMLWEQVRSETGVVIDYLWLIKNQSS